MAAKKKKKKKAKGQVPIGILKSRYNRLGKIILTRTGGLPKSK